ncbi:MAG: DsrE family protein [Planctomycetota bacterium]|jgi:hypothetical protein
MATTSGMSNTLVMVRGPGLGEGPDELRSRVFGTWTKIVLENGDPPAAIAFYTEGVRLCCEGSPVLDELRAMEEAGVRLILCRTCLVEFDLEDKAVLGIVGGMGDIVAAQTLADKVITL